MKRLGLVGQSVVSVGRLRAVPLQSVESKLGRTGESELPASPRLSLASLDSLARVTNLRDCARSIQSVKRPKKG